MHRTARALLVVDCLEGPSAAHALALRCMQVCSSNLLGARALQIWQEALEQMYEVWECELS